jgi:hypothetical protein
MMSEFWLLKHGSIPRPGTQTAETKHPHFTDHAHTRYPVPAGVRTPLDGG